MNSPNSFATARIGPQRASERHAHVLTILEGGKNTALVVHAGPHEGSDLNIVAAAVAWQPVIRTPSCTGLAFRTPPPSVLTVAFPCPPYRMIRGMVPRFAIACSHIASFMWGATPLAQYSCARDISLG